jgi:hypothetical protein
VQHALGEEGRGVQYGGASRSGAGGLARRQGGGARPTAAGHGGGGHRSVKQGTSGGGGPAQKGGGGIWAAVALGCWAGWERWERTRPKKNMTLFIYLNYFKKI